MTPERIPFAKKYQALYEFIDDLYKSKYQPATKPKVIEKTYGTIKNKYLEFDVTHTVNGQLEKKHWMIKIIEDKNKNVWVDRDSHQYAIRKFIPPVSLLSLDSILSSKRSYEPSQEDLEKFAAEDASSAALEDTM